MLCDPESVALQSCLCVRDTSCRRENYAFDSSAGIWSSRGSSPALKQPEREKLRRQQRTGEAKELSFDVLSLQWRPLCDQIMTCGWIEIPDIWRVAVD